MEVILVLNAGSSSLKFQILAADAGLARQIRGQIDGIGVHPRLRATGADGAVLIDRTWAPADLPDLPAATEALRGWLSGLGGVELRAVGHRVVHGGPDFDRPVRIDADILARLTALEPLAPLHQPHNLAAIRVVAAIDPDLPQVACFDTAFHRGHPAHTDCYALPRALYDEGVRRYGFHGLSYEYIASRLPDLAPEIAGGRVIVAHLGSGASMCALAAGRSVESTMGFTALDGLPMGTRPGQLDPGVVLHLIEQRGMAPAEVTDLLYKSSGLKGLSGVSNDMRDLLASDDPGAAFAIDHFVHRAALHAGSLAAALGGLDAFVFTAGIGERSAPIRARIAERLAWLGAALDPAANEAGALRISTPESRVALLVIPTDEELMIARHTLALSSPEGSPHDPPLREGQAPRRQEGPDRRHRQRPLDRLGLRARLPRPRRRPRDHLPQREGQAPRRAARPRGRGADLHADGRHGRRRTRGRLRPDRPDWGKLDFVVHSIAFSTKEALGGRVTDVPRDGFQVTMDVSVWSFLRMAHLAEPLMKDGGTLFTMTYYGSEKVVENYNIMGVAKAALESAVRYLAAELGPKGIRVHAISPGPLATRAASGIPEFDALLEKAKGKAPSRALVDIDDVGMACAFLAHDAARLMTGQVLYIDGGYNIID